MKLHLAFASVMVLELYGLAVAQPAPQGTPVQGVVPIPGAGRGPAAPAPVATPDNSDRLAGGEYQIGPDYAPAPELTVKADDATGTVHEFVMKAEDSKIYPGQKRKVGYTGGRDSFGNNNAVAGDVQWEDAPYAPRHVWVYVPGGYKPGTPIAVMIVQDGHSYQDRLHKILDTMISQKRLPPIVAVSIDPGSTPQGAARAEDAQGSERGHEYDTMSGKYSDFLEKEVLPKIAKDYHITFTKDPEGRATMGGSSGAAAAFTMAWYHPERYHRVLLYSPTFVNQQSPVDPATPHGAWEYHDHLIAQSPKKPIRIWFEVGENDNHYQDPDETFHNWVTAANRTAAVLKSKGYDYRFVFAKGARHVDGRVVDQTLADALTYVWEGYKPGKR